MFTDLNSMLSRFPVRQFLPPRRFLSGPACLLLLAAWSLLAGIPGVGELHAAAPSYEVSIDWSGDKPVLTATVDGIVPPEGMKAFSVGFRVVEAGNGQEVMNKPLDISLEKGLPATGSLTIDGAADPKKQYSVTFAVHSGLGIDLEETLNIAAADQPVRVFGIRRTGTYPNEHMALRFGLQGFPDKQMHDIPATIVLRDGDDNAIRTIEAKLTPTAKPTWHLVDITPDTAVSVGPYIAEFSLESDAPQIYFSSSKAFGFANARVPVSSLESNEALWFPSTGLEDPFRFQGGNGYYSKHLIDVAPKSYPRMEFDSAAAHSGQRGLRIDYNSGSNADVYTMQTIPGKPMEASVWVRGNNSNDELWVHFSDQINYTLQAWVRNPAFSRARLCVLNFEGWREFRVPVLGAGLQVTGKKGSTAEIDAPISFVAFSVKTNRLGKDEKPEPRSVAIDDLSAITQVRLDDRLSMEVLASDPNGNLKPDTRLNVSIGNGSGGELKAARLALTARDANGQTVWTDKREVAVPDGGFTVVEFALADLAAKQPVGPVDIDVAVTVPAQAGLRASGRATLKSASNVGLIDDFEAATDYSSFEPGKTFTDTNLSRVDGGADGSGHALALQVRPDKTINSVLLNPSLPGIVDSVDVMIFGGERPVTVQPWFIDSSYTGIWQRNYNVFWPTPILVDWKGWRKVTIAAPPVPAWYGDTNRYFFNQPWYPLSLAFNATVQADDKATEPVTIRLDDVMVRTHLKPENTLKVAVNYADETHIHAPGSALQIALRSFAAGPLPVNIGWKLTHYQGQVTAQGEIKRDLPPGSKSMVTLVDKLVPGIYDLELTGVAANPTHRPVLVLDAKAYFGDDPATFIKNMVDLRKTVGMTTEKAYLDWDNTEPVPYIFNFGWFNIVSGKQNGDGAFTLQPVLGFAADWAGPDAQEALRRATYLRTIANYLQVPVRTVDWSRFVRECLREYQGKFDSWTFWENPDLDEAPQGIRPDRYAALLAEVYHWTRVYEPKARVVAGGFNFNKVLNYLDQIPDVDKLKFDDIAVQMNLGELSPERSGMDGFLDDLNSMLHLQETNRRVLATELDWGIGEYVTPLQQAAYHVRAALILDARGAPPHQFSLINAGNTFDGYGVFYREEWGNGEDIQTFRDYNLPKPGYFSLLQTQRFLAAWHYVSAVALPDRNLESNRAFIYRNDAGRLTVAIWRISEDIRSYRLPASWKGVAVTDAFGFPVVRNDAVLATPLPFFYQLPEGYDLDNLKHDLRHLSATDDSYPVVLDLHLSEPASAKAANWQGAGTMSADLLAGVLPGGRKIREPLVTGLTGEQFTFDAPAAGPYLLRRRWLFGDKGAVLHVKLNDGAEQVWDLGAGQDNSAGPRESTFLLADCKVGANTVAVRYDAPGNCSGYRIEPLPADHVPLVRWGILNSRQSVGDVIAWQSATGTPLKIGDKPFESGLGAHAVSFLEYPLDGRFARFSVTVGVDSSTEGRGTVVFRVYADDKEVANSGNMNGFSPAKVLEVGDLSGVRRLILSVQDGGDGTAQDLADWVDGKLYWK